MAIGEFTKAESEEVLEALRRMFNAIAPDERKNNLIEFSRIGTYIQATQRHLEPLCGDTPKENTNGF